MSAEEVTSFAKQMLNIIILKHPSRTWVGGLVGLGICVLHQVSSTVVLGRDKGVLYSGPEWHLFTLGFLIVYIPAIYQHIKSSPEFDEDIETAFKAIERASKGGMSRANTHAQYMRLIEKVIERVGGEDSKRRDREVSSSLKD